LSRARARGSENLVPIDAESMKALEALLKIAEKKGVSVVWLKEQVKDIRRMNKLGITNEQEFRQAAEDLSSLLSKKPKEKDAERQIREKTHALIGVKIPGFFPTPKPVVSEMMTMAGIEEGMSVLEPSAGKGDIADALKEAGTEPAVVEVVPSLQDILKLKGHKLVGSDFLEHAGKYDRIVMNPPFEKGQDIDHVKHAYKLLNEGGRLVSIMSESPFFRSDKKATEFREWLESVGGTDQKLEDRAFTGKEAFRQTGVSGRLVVIDKPGEPTEFFRAVEEAPPPEFTDIYSDKVPPTDVPSRIALQDAVAMALNADYKQVRATKKKYKGVKDEKALYEKEFKNRPELFLHPENPLPEMRAAWTIATKGKGLFGAKAGFVDVTPLAKVHEMFMSIVEPSKAVEIAQGKDVYAEVIKATHKADVAMIEFNEKELETLDRTLGEWGKALGKYPKRILENLMLSRGKPVSAEAIAIRDNALQQLIKEAPELVGTRKMITRASDFNYDYLKEVVGDEIAYVEDYFYGIYKEPRKVEKFLNHWKTTKRFTKEKKLPSVADAKAFGLELRDPNPVNNLRSEYLAIARLEGMIGLKESLMKQGEGKYIDKTELAPIEWDKVHDPVFADVRVAPELARMINSLISTNKITRIPLLNAIRQVNNFLRTVKFIGSAFHLGVEAKQAVADSGYLGFYHKKTALRGITTGFKKSDPIFQTPEYRDYIAHGGGHRYSVDSEAQRAFSNMVDKINAALGVPGAGKAIRGAAFVGQLPETFVKWMFENYIPKVKYGKYLDTVREQEVKVGRSLTSAEKIDIIKEGQNFYGMMNERLFGRSGTVTTLLRFKFMAPGFAEGNFRTMLKAILQWGGDEGFKAHRSRSNIINSFIISATLATVGTLILTGKPPKKPETLADVRDVFKIDTGRVDQNGRRIMIDLLTYDKDYWGVFGNLATGQPGEAAETLIKRLGGMTSTTWEVLSDLNQLSMGKAIYDWKGDRVTEVTDSFIQKVLKLSIHELKKAEPISANVFQQGRKKGVGTALAAAMTLAGVRLAKSEQDKREIEILSQIFSLRDQQEALYWYLGSIKDPREQIKKYNQTVMRILDNPITPLEVKDEYGPKLIIDVDRLISNKVYNYLGDRARLAEYRRTPEKYRKEIKELKDDVQKAHKWLKNFEIAESQYKKHLKVYELKHRKVIKEIQPEDNMDELKDELATFYAEKTLVSRELQTGIEVDRNRRLLRKYSVIGDNVAQIARRIYETEDPEKRERYFKRIQSAIRRVKD
jgi:predicted RNA methylase